MGFTVHLAGGAELEFPESTPAEAQGLLKWFREATHDSVATLTSAGPVFHVQKAHITYIKVVD